MGKFTSRLSGLGVAVGLGLSGVRSAALPESNFIPVQDPDHRGLDPGQQYATITHIDGSKTLLPANTGIRLVWYWVKVGPGATLNAGMSYPGKHMLFCYLREDPGEEYPTAEIFSPEGTIFQVTPPLLGHEIPVPEEFKMACENPYP